jgi:hypothetical protein
MRAGAIPAKWRTALTLALTTKADCAFAATHAPTVMVYLRAGSTLTGVTCNLGEFSQPLLVLFHELLWNQGTQQHPFDSTCTGSNQMSRLLLPRSLQFPRRSTKLFC